MPPTRRECGRDRHRRSVTRSICVKNKVARVCKHGARGAHGKGPKARKVRKAAGGDMSALRAKYPRAFKN
jgi:hypothetical protein